tara:strand:- start:118154 stop:120919 length:2766 start_codon:yes stop_codon:yes gene_type:complete
MRGSGYAINSDRINKIKKASLLMLTGNDIRAKFLNFFESKGHTIVASSSLIPDNDPTLMFVNAGMNQFKNLFTGVETRDYVRATSSQRCVRAGGKHNDLENVGHTARHHTFFEMLGNFSFGDYFKEDAIPYAWEFLTSKEYIGLDASKLYVTVYHTDDEAYDIWHKKVGLPEDRIIRIATDDNYWSMGDTGPCGPCSEIFYDHGADIWGGLPGTPEEDGDRFIEIWNIVFMQFEKFADGKKIPLPQTGVDTGCGLERLTAVLQHQNNNYDIDLFQHIIKKASALSGIEYGKNEENTTSLRVLADHIRCTSFLLVDGVMPSNEGSGYVLRRIMRRAMRHINLLGINEPFFYKLVAPLCEIMGEQYPELARAKAMVEDVIKTEEERFITMLKRGTAKLNSAILELKTAVAVGEENLDEKLSEMNAKNRVLSGKIAFELYDTFGFPLDLTEMICRESGVKVDVEGYEACMAEQRAKARAAGMGGTGQQKLSAVWFDLRDVLPATEFLGYMYLKAEGQIMAIVKADAKNEKAMKGEKVIIVTNQTPFYAESGGQVGDSGFVKTENGTAKVLDTRKILDGALFQHFCEVSEGEIKIGDTAELNVDVDRRGAITKNHTGTHLMHKVLQDVLGDHVFQKGSVVDENRLRFDFSQPKALTAEQITEIEKRVNDMIWENTQVVTRLMDKDAAVEAGAMALFGEKYDSEVRVLSMGEKVKSVELCGGVHVKRTGDIGLFKLLSDSSVSAGVRRIEAVTGKVAFDYLSAQDASIRNIAGLTKVKPSDVEARIADMQTEIKKLKNDIKNAQKGGGNSGQSPSDLANAAETINDVKFVSLALDGVEAGVLREMIDDIKNALGTGVVVLASNNGDKSSIVCGVTKDLVGKYKAGDIVSAAAATLGGKGGGRPDMAMAGGRSGDLTAALAAAKAVL